MSPIKELLSPEVCSLITDARINLPQSADDTFNYILELSEPAVEFDDTEQEELKNVILKNYTSSDFIFSQILIAAQITVFRDEIIPDTEYLAALLNPEKYIHNLNDVIKIRKVLEYIDSDMGRKESGFEKMLDVIEKHIRETTGREIKKLSERVEKLEKNALSPAPANPPPLPVVPVKKEAFPARECIFAGTLASLAFTASLAAVYTAIKTNSPGIFMFFGICLSAAGFYLLSKAKK